MITEKQFDTRAKQLFKSRQAEVAAKYWKGGKRKGQLREPAVSLPFNYPQFELWLFRQIGYQSAPCLYCSIPIDILSLSIDHKTPRAHGGSIALDNLQILCKECNERKGDLSHEQYMALLSLLSPPEHAYLRREVLKRLDAAAAGSRARFFRNRDTQQRKKAAVEVEPF